MYRQLDELVRAASSLGPIKVAVAAGHDPDVIEAMKQAKEMKLAEGIFIGNSEKIRAFAGKLGFPLPEEQIIHELDESAAARKAIALIREGKAHLLMKGKISTAALIRAVLDKEFGLRAGRLLSQVIVFQVPGL